MSSVSGRVGVSDEGGGNHQSFATGTGVNVWGVTRALQIVAAVGAGAVVVARDSAAWAVAGAGVAGLAAIASITVMELGKRHNTVGSSLFASPHSAWDKSIGQLNDIFSRAGAVVNETYRRWVRDQFERIAGSFGSLANRELHAEAQAANRIFEDLLEASETASAVLAPKVARSHLMNASARFTRIVQAKAAGVGEKERRTRITLIILHSSSDDRSEVDRIVEEWHKLGVAVSTLNTDKSRSVEISSGGGGSFWILEDSHVDREVVVEAYDQAKGFLAIKAFFERADKTRACKQLWTLFSDYVEPFAPGVRVVCSSAPGSGMGPKLAI